MLQQVFVFIVISLSLVLFVSERIRYDLTAMLALLLLIFGGVIAPENAFFGFGHPAVISVAAVLIISRGLLYSGAVDYIEGGVSAVGNNLSVQLMVLTSLITLFSAFMNNVGALALFLPVGLKIAYKSNRPPSLYLMPLAFGSLLGGMISMIGTPPNIIIALYRQEEIGQSFKMFDFTPVGLGIAIVGIVFIAFLGWRFLPKRQAGGSHQSLFHVEDYISELRVLAESRFINKPLRELNVFGEQGVLVVGIIRGEKHFPAPSRYEIIKEDDILVVEADAKILESFVERNGLELEGRAKVNQKSLKSEEISLFEVVIMPDSPLVGRTAKSVNLRWQYGLNLLAVARQGHPLKQRLSEIRFLGGDILLLQGSSSAYQDSISSLSCLPLAERDLRFSQESKMFKAVLIFLVAILLIVFRVMPLQVCLVAASVAMILSNVISLRRAYESIEWPVIILLGAMIPVGEALESSGGAALIAETILNIAGMMPLYFNIFILMLVTMILSNIVNNATAAILMAPIAVSLSKGLGVSVDPLLMAVAISASSSFLTPIGHQSNVLVMGPGGYRFSDYWKLGLPLSILVLIIAMPLLIFFWVQ